MRIGFLIKWLQQLVDLTDFVFIKSLTGITLLYFLDVYSIYFQRVRVGSDIFLFQYSAVTRHCQTGSKYEPIGLEGC